MANLIHLKYYENNIEANRNQQILMENGIESFIANEQTIQSDWLLSQALGGIRLQVFEENLVTAKKILDDFNDSDDSALEVEHTIENPPFDFVCPKCGSNHFYQDEKLSGLFGISLLFLGLPLNVKKNLYHCYYCNEEFSH